jgi:hypothetical protein
MTCPASLSQLARNFFQTGLGCRAGQLNFANQVSLRLAWAAGQVKCDFANKVSCSLVGDAGQVNWTLPTELLAAGLGLQGRSM